LEFGEIIRSPTQPQILYFWGADFLERAPIKIGSWFKRLFKSKGEINAGSLKELKALIRKLSKDGAPDITQKELNKLEKLVKEFGGTVRRDLNPIRKARGRLDPHVQIEDLGKSVESRKIFIKKGVN